MEFRPAPKRKRIVSKEQIDGTRDRDRECMAGLLGRNDIGACAGGLDVHHIISKGVGGDDVKENLILLCRWHHSLTETRHITPEELKSLLSKYYGYAK